VAWLYSFESKEIQKYIMRSDKLKDMVGGSELINQLCDSYLPAALKSMNVANRCDIIAKAAGWARISFAEKQDAELLFSAWPFLVARFAPGLQVIQSLQEIHDGGLPAAIKVSADQLRYARNLVSVSLPEISPLVERNPRTGLAAVAYDERDSYLDRQSIRKRHYTDNASLVGKITGAEAQKKLWPGTMEDIAGDQQSYIAIIHADGNDLGKSLIALGQYLEKHRDKAADIYRGFSNAIEESTVEAVKRAFNLVIDKDFAERKAEFFAARPIVLGGDDLTIIIRADMAFEFTVQFLEQFEICSAAAVSKYLGAFNVSGLPGKLTACAGITLVKSSFPFSQGYELAESLCSYTKKIAKEKSTADGYVPSSFTFHKVTNSLADDYEAVVANEMTVQHGETAKSLSFGPYSVGLSDNLLPRYSDMVELVRVLADFPSGTIRTWISTLYADLNQAAAEFERLLQIAGKEKAAKLKDALTALTGETTDPLWSSTGATPLRDAHEMKGIFRRDVFEKGENNAKR